MTKGTTLPPEAGWLRKAADRDDREPTGRFPERPRPPHDAGEASMAALEYRPPTRIYPGL